MQGTQGLSVEGLTILKKQPNGHLSSFGTAILQAIHQQFDIDGDGSGPFLLRLTTTSMVRFLSGWLLVGQMGGGAGSEKRPNS